MWDLALLTAIFTVSCISLYFLNNYFNGGVCRCQDRLDGKTVIVTGGNCGIGKQTALILARKGAKVILACRDIEKGKQAADEIVSATGNEKISVHRLDLTSFASVRRFCDEILRSERRLDVLVNNAAVYFVPFSLTEDGHETVFQSNYLGHFLLTQLLLKKLRENRCGRIVNVSSIIYQSGKINFDDLNGKTKYGKHAAYAQSKLALILFTRHLARELKDEVTVHALHPGIVRTEITRKLLWLQSFLGRILNYAPMQLLFKSAEQGSQTTVHCAVSKQCGKSTGLYFKDCKVAALTRNAEDDEVAERLWNVSFKLVGLEAEKFTSPSLAPLNL